MATGIITENWTMTPGPGGLPRHRVTGWCTYDRSTIQRLERNSTIRPKFTPIPNSRRLTAMSLDGQNITTVMIDVPNYGRITNCVKVGPVQWQDVAPKQTTGDYAGYEIKQYTIEYQQLEYNHI